MISADDPDLVVVVESCDDAEAASAVLERSSGWRPEEPAVLRHHLSLPSDAINTARALLAQDGWELRPAEGPGADDRPDLAGFVAVRVQKLDALHCSQESSRMASLAQRHGGRAVGWDALQPAPN
ncbi:hypothetical protein [Saccharopolyspora griseoalba]|uniref:Uncharacterized protein n=1 Tax=Saccharopolyspora griseoalba TaxID=1431848 RepID=A0ABW2LR30_9PSEU